ncbi:sentrin-specific protease 1, partial [Falco peregrinus]|uniref:sentrin-specific protease 1 n=1 Tax=Falco peregrinus TaxID=8954 RepID=UPI00247898F1
MRCFRLTRPHPLRAPLSLASLPAPLRLAPTSASVRLVAGSRHRAREKRARPRDVSASDGKPEPPAAPRAGPARRFSRRLRGGSRGRAPSDAAAAHMRMEARDAARGSHGSAFKAFALPPRAGLREPLSQPDSKFLTNKIGGFTCPAGNASCALNYSPEVPCPESYRVAGEPRAFGSSANGQWRGLVPPLGSVPQKPRVSRGSYLEARKNASGTSNSFVGKSNHHCHASAFPIKPAQSPSWSGPCRRSLHSPKKTPRRFISTAEETVREEEREIYRQLLQMVTGKQFSTSKPSSLFPFHLSRCSNSSKTVVKETPSKNSKLFETHSIAPASSASSVLGAQEQPSHKPPLYSAPTYPSHVFESSNSTAQHQQENLPASNTASPKGWTLSILLKVKDSRTPAPSLPFFQAELWIKELTSVYDSRARDRWRQIEEQKALALQLQSQ